MLSLYSHLDIKFVLSLVCCQFVLAMICIFSYIELAVLMYEV